MPKLWKFISRNQQDTPKVEGYQFPDSEEMTKAVPFSLTDFSVEADEPAEEPKEVKFVLEPDPPEEEKAHPSAVNPVDYAQLQADLILQRAEAEAEKILSDARQEAARLSADAYEKAKEMGFQKGREAGYQDGVQEGSQWVMGQSDREREEFAQRVEADVAEFLEKAADALDRQLEQNVEDLRDLALAVAEKIVCISLKSSSDVVARMIQTAIDKRKRREWVHIYIAECDAKRMASVPPSLAAALAELSDRVRIIPMADDEAGTCIIECPDEIIDASAATQMKNIRDMLEAQTTSAVAGNLNFMK